MLSEFDGKLFFGSDDSDANSFSIVNFEMREGTLATHEKPFERETPKGDFVPSTRNDGTTHYIEDRARFFIMHQGGPEVVAKAKAFTDAYQLYVAQFCAVIG